jgi:hypothetical protein
MSQERRLMHCLTVRVIRKEGRRTVPQEVWKAGDFRKGVGGAKRRMRTESVCVGGGGGQTMGRWEVGADWRRPRVPLPRSRKLRIRSKGYISRSWMPLPKGSPLHQRKRTVLGGAYIILTFADFVALSRREILRVLTRTCVDARPSLWRVRPHRR